MFGTKRAYCDLTGQDTQYVEPLRQGLREVSGWDALNPNFGVDERQFVTRLISAELVREGLLPPWNFESPDNSRA